MDQRTPIEQPKGNFVMNINFRRASNSDAPAITGRISAPETPDRQFDFSAFAQQETDKVTGEIKTYFIGPVNNTSSMREALAQKKERGTHFIAIRPNQFKIFATLDDGTPNPDYEALSDHEKAQEDLKPDWWAKWTRDANLPVLDASAWEREANRYGPWASGNTQHHLTKEQAAQMLNAAEEHGTAEPSRSSKRTRKQDAEPEMSR